MPFAAYLAYWLTTGGDPDFRANEPRRRLRPTRASLGVLFGLWIALGAMVRQREALARDQALAFELERSELERRRSTRGCACCRRRSQPHFLFNTLANVQALVDAGSPQASAVLDSLIAYLRAAVPRLHEPATTLGQELQLVRAYLELMHMRMPDRLQFALHVDDDARGAALPADDAADAGRERRAPRHRSRARTAAASTCDVRAARRPLPRRRSRDTGVGLRATGDGLGTGLSTLRERLQLAFGGDAQLRAHWRSSRTASRAELDFPRDASVTSRHDRVP